MSPGSALHKTTMIQTLVAALDIHSERGSGLKPVLVENCTGPMLTVVN